MEQAWGEAEKSAFLVGIPGVSYPKSHCKKHSMRELHRIPVAKIKTRDEFALGKMVYEGPTSCPPIWGPAMAQRCLELLGHGAARMDAGVYLS